MRTIPQSIKVVQASMRLALHLADIEQMTLGYLFDDHAKALSRSKLTDQLPRLMWRGPQI
jgi:hypothetical protein